MLQRTLSFLVGWSGGLSYVHLGPSRVSSYRYFTAVQLLQRLEGSFSKCRPKGRRLAAGSGAGREETGAGPPRRARILTESVLFGQGFITTLPALGPSFIFSGK